MDCKRKRAIMAPLTSSLLLLCLGAHHIINGPFPCSMAFSPPSHRQHDVLFSSSHSTSSTSRSTRDRVTKRSQTDDDLFFAQDLDYEQRVDGNYNDNIESSSNNSNDYTTQGEFGNEEAMYNMDSSMNNNNMDPSFNTGNDSGGMDAYAQQMQEFTSAEPNSGTFETMEPRIESPPPVQQTEYTTSTNPDAPETTSNNQPISSVDARVLESILQEGKLDLSTEDQVKQLLEGPRLQEGENVPTSEEDGKYSSKFVSAVSDNTFWNSLKAKANEIIDSVGIYIENRIERDTQTLAAVGLFTVDRIRRDIGRALPAAGRATRQLLLSTNSTYAEKLLDVTDKTPFALPAERSLTDREMLDGYNELYEELTTPADEIRQVTEAIRDILSGKELTDASSSSYTNARRGVRSFAPAGTSKLAERQRRAYKARKQTVLKRESEGIDRKVSRAFGSVTDATWEFRREMQTDAGREAGYRSKGVRKALAAGAAGLLEAGRTSARLLGGGGDNKRRGMIGGNTAGVEVLPNIVDVSPMEEEELIEDVIEETNMEYAPDGLLSPQSFVEEKRRLITSLESCLSQPSETWLTLDVVAQATESGISLDGTVLREVITNMVTLRDRLQKEMEQIAQEQVDLKMEYVQMELRRMKQMVDSVSSVAISAAGESAAILLKQELEGFVLSDSLDDIIEIELERMEQLLAEMVAAREEEMQYRTQQREEEMRARKQRYQQQMEQERFVDTTTAVATEVVDSTFSRATVAGRNDQFGNEMFTEVEVVSSSDTMGAGYPNDNSINQEGQDQYYPTSSSSVEVVSDTEYSEYEKQFKSAQSDTMGEDDDINDAEENPATNFVLRVVDVFFFVGEKFFLVLLPDLITGGAKISSRYAQANNRGRGSVGWKPLKNVKTKNIR